LFGFSEEYLRAKSAAQLATPVRAELDKLRQAGDHRGGLAGILQDDSSPSSMTPVSAFIRGMATYRPGGKSILSFEEGT
jgi:hypothetical protein